MISLLTSQPWVERLGWTLVHFLWQGVLFAALYAAARRMVKPSRPGARYTLACVALAAMTVAPFVTWALMPAPDAAPAPGVLIAHVPISASSGTNAAPVAFAETNAPSAPFLPWVVAAWLIGAMVFWMRLFAGWMGAARLRSAQVRPAPTEWQRTLDRLKARVGVSRPVRLLVSALVQAPAVVGWLKPVVLVPVGALAGLPSAQIEALLLHELAHIRRHDYLVNILQSVAEALLFYHPAVWWVSGQIRAEREMCCDDIAVALTGDVFTYALALAELESSRPAHLHAAMASNGGSLAGRIARMLGQSRPASRRLPGTAAFVTAILLVVAAYGAFAQSADAPKFAVASIKRGQEFTLQVPMSVRALPGGRLSTTNAPLNYLLQRAYGVEAFQIAGGPGWVATDGYNIEAKPESTADQKQMWLMLQSLIAERFKLKLHRETRELPVYALTALKGGPKLPAPKAGLCNEVMPPPDASREQRMAPPCGPGVVAAGTGLKAQGLNLTMAKFAGFLGKLIGRSVIDRTGYTKNFDLGLEFAFDDTIVGLPHGPAIGDPDPSAKPNLMTAVQEQLGLKLESTKGPVEVLVIDSVERPTEN